MKRWMIALLAGWVVLLAGWGGAAWGGEPPTAPILRLEIGMHTDMIGTIGVDAAGHWLVSASHDKTLRLWSLPDLRLVRTIRPPIGDGPEGHLHAVAISPDGALIATGGWTGFAWNGEGSIYLFDRASGRMVRRIGGLPNVIDHLAFSNDGRYLAVSLATGGIRVWDTRDWRQVGKDGDYGSDSEWCDFSADGRLVTSSWDGWLRLYDRDFRLQYKAKAPGGKLPYAVAFSPDGSRIAVGFADTSNVNVLDGHTHSLLYSPDTGGVNNGNLGAVAWSADGHRLYAGGNAAFSGYDDPVRRWQDGGRGSYRDLSVSSNTVMDFLPLPAGGVAIGSYDPAITLLAANGAIVRQIKSGIADFSHDFDGFQLSRNGMQVKFDMASGSKRPVLFDVGQRRLQEPAPAVGGLQPADTGSLKIAEWKDSAIPTLNGRPLQIEQYEASRSLAIAPDRRSFLLGTEWYLRRFDANGKEIWKEPAPGAAWVVNISGDGRLAVAALGDGTIRWYRSIDGKPLLSFFLDPDGKRWIMWTPDGYYDSLLRMGSATMVATIISCHPTLRSAMWYPSPIAPLGVFQSFPRRMVRPRFHPLSAGNVSSMRCVRRSGGDC